MSALVPLHFDRFDVRMIVRDGEPWWVLNDVCAVLEIANPRNAAKRLDDYQKGVHTMDTLGGRQDLIVVNEPGIYALTLSSRKAEAKTFAKWLFTEVLPSIRRFGMYPAPVIHVAQDGVENSDATPHHRFLSEIDRIAAELGFTASDILDGLISDPLRRAIALGTPNMVKMLSRDERWARLANLGMDMPYVLTGQRSITAQERRVIAGMRNANLDHRMIAA